MKIQPAKASDHEALVDIWLRSARATHAFLTEADIQTLLPLVRDNALANLELWVLVADDGELAGFMGLGGASVEALFLAPPWLRRGGGRMLIEHARRLKGPLTVEVNEQNPAAIQFYGACGFVVAGRTATDRDGRPFPLLQMQQKT